MFHQCKLGFRWRRAEFVDENGSGGASDQMVEAVDEDESAAAVAAGNKNGDEDDDRGNVMDTEISAKFMDTSANSICSAQSKAPTLTAGMPT